MRKKGRNQKKKRRGRERKMNEKKEEKKGEEKGSKPILKEEKKHKLNLGKKIQEISFLLFLNGDITFPSLGKRKKPEFP